MNVRGSVILALLAIGCGGEMRWPWESRPASPPSASAVHVLDDADAEVAAGRPHNAIALYESVLKEHAGDDAGARALHALAMLRLDPRSPVHDRRAGQQLLMRLATEYPKTPWGHEAQLWRLLGRQIDRCEAEASRLGADAERMRQTLDSLKDSDLELEGRP